MNTLIASIAASSQFVDTLQRINNLDSGSNRSFRPDCFCCMGLCPFGCGVLVPGVIARSLGRCSGGREGHPQKLPACRAAGRLLSRWRPDATAAIAHVERRCNIFDRHTISSSNYTYMWLKHISTTFSTRPAGPSPTPALCWGGGGRSGPSLLGISVTNGRGWRKNSNGNK